MLFVRVQLSGVRRNEDFKEAKFEDVKHTGVGVKFDEHKRALMLSTHVPFQSTRFTKALLAHITFIRFLVRMNTHVGFQTTRLSKTLLAHITFIRFLVRVNTHVNFQIASLSKTLLTHIAFEHLVRVNTHVPFSNYQLD